MRENDITGLIIDSCVKLRKTLGPGLLESVYEEVLAYELKKNNLSCQRQVDIPVAYEKIIRNLGFRADLVVDDKVIVELKSVESILPVHKKQLLTYLKLTGEKLVS